MSAGAKQLTPRLVVARAAQAIDFYVKALGATEVGRHADPEQGGLIVHAELKLDDVSFTLTEEQRQWGNLGPRSLGGTPVILHLEVADADEVGRRMQAEGAEVVFPIADQFYGRREGRLRDPFGHLWIISQARG
jgi:PhnB protein